MVNENIKIKIVSMSNNHLIAYVSTKNNNESILLLGSNYFCQLGLTSNIKYIDKPILVNINIFLGIKKDEKIQIIKLKCVDTFTLILTSNGNIYYLGNYKYNELFLNEKITESKNNEDIDLIKYNINQINPKYYNNELIIDIISYEKHCILISNKNNIYSFGINMFYQCGLPNTNDILYIKYPLKIDTLSTPMIQVKSIECGINYSCILTKNGVIYTFGSNKFGELGLGNEINYKQIPTYVTFYNNKNISIEIDSIKIFCGAKHTLIMDTNNNIWGFGYNKYKQISDNENEIIWLPKKLSYKNIIDFYVGHWYSILISNN